MDNNTIFVKRYSGTEGKLASVNEREVWRYAGCRGVLPGADDALYALFRETIEECAGIFRYRLCFSRFPLVWKNESPVLPFPCSSKDLALCLKGCSQAVMFAGTVGLEIDRKISRYKHFLPTKALFLQALGAERIEALCDTFCGEFRADVCREGLDITPRFSPGYGDLPLELQSDFVRILDCSRQAGISLSSSMLMTPSKSVTAIFGLKASAADESSGNPENKCASCPNKDCEYRDTI